MADLRWYAIQTTAGHENKVRSLIARRIAEDARPETEKPIRQALVPTQEVVEIKNGKKVNVERKIYPGYVLVEMDLNQETIHTINGIQGVIRFVGTARLPMPLRPTKSTGCSASKKRSRKKSPRRRFRFSWARSSRSRKGRSPISAGRSGSPARQGKVRVSVALFGRPTSVELDYCS
jgi:transcriptional antiterminator NusG